MGFPDLMMVFFGQTGPLEGLRQPLQSFVGTNILNGQEPTDDNIQSAVDRLMLLMDEDLHAASVCIY